MMMTTVVTVQTYEKDKRGAVHSNDGHLKRRNGKVYDTGYLVEFGVDDDECGVGIIKAQHSSRCYAFKCDAALALGIDHSASDDTLYEFEAVFNANEEMWHAENVNFHSQQETDQNQQSNEDNNEDDADAVGGVVTRYFDDRGYGFIESDDSGATPSASEYFFHISRVDEGLIAEGDYVYFYEEWDENKQRFSAVDIIIANDEKD